MATELYVDLILTTLSGSINNSTTSVAVTSATGMPATGNFTILVEEGSTQELMHVTSRSGATLTVATRGTWGTAASSFTSAATVKLVLSSLAFDAIRANISQIGVYASLPSSGMKQGDLYKCSDCKYDFFYNGSVWVPFYDGMSVTLPPTGSWSWTNQGGSTVTNTLGKVNLYLAGSASQWRLYRRAYPSPPFTLTVRFQQMASPMDVNGTGTASDGIGIGFRATGSGNFVAFYLITQPGSKGYLLEKWNGVNSFNASWNGYTTLSTGGMEHLVNMPVNHMRIVDDNVNHTFYISPNGEDWFQVDQRARTSFITPDELCITARNNSTENSHMFINDWTVS